MRIVVLLVITLSFTACKKDPTSWKNQLQTPLIHGELDFKNFIEDTILAPNGDGSLQFIWNKEILALNIDSLANIPDTTIKNNFSISVNSITANPGFEFVDDTKNFVVNSSDVELKEVLLTSGKVAVSLESPLTEATVFEIIIPAASYNGTVFSKAYDVAPGSASNPTIVKDTVDFSNYRLDLTGLNGNQVNTLQIQFKVKVASDGNAVTITDNDVIKMETTFQDLLPKYARGYFGEHNFDIQDTLAIDFMNQFVGGSIDIDAINFNFIIENSFDLTARGRINEIVSYNKNTGSSVSLTHPGFGQWHNINPTDGSWDNLQPFRKTFNFTSSNSNIEAFLEILPQKLIMDFNGEVNPLGNTTGGHDEMFPDSKLSLLLEADFPVQIAADKLKFQDTIDVPFKNKNETIKVVSGELIMEGNNYMPLGAEAKFYIYDSIAQKMTPIEVKGTIGAPALDQNQKIDNPLPYSISITVAEEKMIKLVEQQKMIIEITFNTSGTSTLPVYSDYFFDYRIKSNATTKITY